MLGAAKVEYVRLSNGEIIHQVKGELDVFQKEEIEKKVNKALQQDLSVVIKEANYAQLEKECRFLLPKLPKDKPLRMIKIGEFPLIPDGGVHVKRTKEIGKVWIANIVSNKGKVNVRYGVGG